MAYRRFRNAHYLYAAYNPGRFQPRPVHARVGRVLRLLEPVRAGAVIVSSNLCTNATFPVPTSFFGFCLSSFFLNSIERIRPTASVTRWWWVRQGPRTRDLLGANRRQFAGPYHQSGASIVMPLHRIERGFDRRSAKTSYRQRLRSCLRYHRSFLLLSHAGYERHMSRL